MGTQIRGVRRHDALTHAHIEDPKLYIRMEMKWQAIIWLATFHSGATALMPDGKIYVKKLP
jgi:hypothetical protein